MKHLGNFTRTDLRNLDWFEQLPHLPKNREAARFGLELARLSYDFDLAPWLAAGWTDVSLLVDDRLLTGVHTLSQETDLLQHARNLVLPRLAQGLKGVSNPIKLFTRRQSRNQDARLGAAIVLLKQDGADSFTIAIGFAGTGRRIEDWLGNLRFEVDGPFYSNFTAIAQRFEQEAETINFPQAARSLGLEHFSLQDALTLAGQEQGKIRLVLAGHSRGAAVMQIWACRRLQEGVLASKVAGFGFASPKAAREMGPQHSHFPLYHFLVEDDVFTRLGLDQHLGTCFYFKPDAAFRAACYGELDQDPLFLSLRSLLDQVNCTADSLLFLLAFLEALSMRSTSAIASALAVMMGLGLSELPQKAEEWASGLLDSMKRRFRRNYREVSGSLPNVRALEEKRQAIDKLMETHGAGAVSGMLLKSLQVSHRLVGTGIANADQAPYSYLVVRGFDRLTDEPSHRAHVLPAITGDSKLPTSDSL